MKILGLRRARLSYLRVCIITHSPIPEIEIHYITITLDKMIWYPLNAHLKTYYNYTTMVE